jgi:hypothetical protein
MEHAFTQRVSPRQGTKERKSVKCCCCRHCHCHGQPKLPSTSLHPGKVSRQGMTVRASMDVDNSTVSIRGWANTRHMKYSYFHTCFESFAKQYFHLILPSGRPAMPSSKGNHGFGCSGGDDQSASPPNAFASKRNQVSDIGWESTARNLNLGLTLSRLQLPSSRLVVTLSLASIAGVWGSFLDSVA